MLEVFYSSALRRCELIALRLADIDGARGTVFVRQGKGAKDRYVPIGERAVAWARRYVEEVRPLPGQVPRYRRAVPLGQRGGGCVAEWLTRDGAGLRESRCPGQEGQLPSFSAFSRHTDARRWGRRPLCS